MAEIVAMILIDKLLHLPDHYGTLLIEAGTMVILIFPALYFLSFRPLLLHMNKRRQAENAVRAERQRFNDILETLPAYLILLTPDYRVLFANRFFRERFGEDRGQRCYEYLFGRSQPCEVCETYKVLDNMRPCHWEWTGPDSHIYDVYDFPFTDVNSPTMILEMGVDITEQKQAEAQSREMALFPALNPDGVLQVDETGLIRKINPAAAHMGFFVGAHLAEVIPDLRALDLQACIAGTTRQVYEAHLGERILQWRIQGAPELGLAFLYSRDITERKQAEAALQAASSYNRRLIEASIDPLVTIGPDGKITDVNAATELVTGFQRYNLIGTDFSEYFTQPEKARAGYRQVFQDGSVHDYPLEIRHRDGHTTPVLYNATVYRDESNNVVGVFAAARDITERKQAEEAVRQLSRIVEQTEDTVVVTNYDGVIEYVNPAFERLTGYTKEETLGKTPRVIKSDLHSREFYQNLWNTILAGEVFQDQMANRKKNGELYYEVKTITPLRDVQGNITHFVATGKDITEHKLDEEKLRKAYDELELRVQERTEELRITNFELEQEILERKRAEETLRKANQRLQDQAEELDVQAEELRLQTEELRDTNEQLIKSESTLQSILNATQESIWLFNKDGVILMANKTALSRMKMPAAEIVGRHFDMFMPEEVAQPRMACLTRVADTGGPVELEDQRGGIIFHHTFYPVKDANGGVTGIVAFSRDITDHKQAEEALRLSEKKFALAFANNPAAIALTRLDDGLFLDVNDTWIALTGYSREEAIGHSARKLSIWPSAEAAARFIRELREKGSLHGWEQEFLKKSGEVYVAQLSAQLLTVQNETLILSTLIDITERKRAEGQLEQSNQKLNEIVASIQDDFYVLDRDWVFVYASKLFTSKVGKEPEDFVGNSIWKMFPKHVGTAFEENLRAAMEKREIRRFEIGGKYTTAWYRMTAFPSAEGITVLGTDITERKQAEEKLSQFNRTLKALNRSNQAMLRSRNETELLNEVCKIIIEDCGHAMVWIGFKEEDEQKSVRPVASAGFEEGYIEGMKITWADTERGRGPTGTAIRTGEIRRCRNMLTDPQFVPWREQALKRGYASSIVLPLKMEGNTFGAITIYSRQPDSFIDEEEQLLSELAGDLAYGISALRLRTARAQAEEALRKAHDELELRVQERTQELERRNEELQIISNAERNQRQLSEALVEAALIVNKSLKLDEVLTLILGQIREVIPYSFANIDLMEGDSFYDACHQGDLGQAFNNRFPLESFPLMDKMRQSGKPVLVLDTRAEPNWIVVQDAEAIRSFLSAPLLVEKQVIGFVNLFSEEPGFFTQEMSNRLVAFAAQATVAIQNAWLFEQVRASSERLRTLSRRLVEIQENERLYIARELHDEAGQMLTLLMLDLVTLETQAYQPESILKKIAEMEKTLKAISENLHNVAMALRPAILDHLGLVPALRQYLESIKERYKLKISFEAGNFQERLPAKIETELYRIVQEALTNVVRHAHASRIDVNLTVCDGKLVVMIEDDGSGFEPQKVPNTGHLGLFGMRERAEMIGGQLVIESKLGKGTAVVVEIDYNPSVPDQG